MSQSTCDCDCQSATVCLPIRGISLDVDASALGGQTPAPGGDGVSWSLEEQWTGKYWVDGKKVYQKTVFVGALPANATKQYPHNIVNIKDIIDFKGRATDIRDGTTIVLPDAHPFSTSSGNKSILLYMTNSALAIVNSQADYGNLRDCYVTIWYTCTDR